MDDKAGDMDIYQTDENYRFGLTGKQWKRFPG